MSSGLFTRNPPIALDVPQEKWPLDRGEARGQVHAKVRCHAGAEAS